MIPALARLPMFKSADVSHVHSAINDTNSNTHSYTSVAFGAADPARKIIFCIYGCDEAQASFSVSSVTVVTGSIGATLIGVVEATNQFNRIEFWTANVPTGTSSNVNVVFSEAITHGAISVFRAVGLDTTVHDSRQTVDFTFTETIGVVAGGAVIAAHGYNGQTARVPTWTGVTQGADVISPGDGTADVYYTTASGVFDMPNTAQPVEVTWEGFVGTNSVQGLMISFPPSLG